MAIEVDYLNGHPMIFGIRYEKLYSEVNRLRKEQGLEQIGGLAFARKLHDHVLVENNPRVAEALKNLAGPEKESAPERVQL